MKAENLRKKTLKGLKKNLAQAETDLLKAYLKLAEGRLKDTSRIKAGRKNLARLRTILREKEILESLEKEKGLKNA